MTQTWDGWICLLLLYDFYWEIFIVSRWTYIEPYGKNYQADTDALNTGKNLVQYNRGSWSQQTSFVNEMFHKLACQQM